MSVCNACPRNCGIDRSVSIGICGESNTVRVARIAPHYWEEPCISGKNGSGTVFFSGCALKCVFCQNKNVSHGYIGNEISTAALCDEFLRLESIGVNNINLVTPSHFAPQIIKAASLAKKHGLHLPFLWNSSGYEKVETIKMLDGIIDIYLPDFKYKSGILSKKYSGAADYFEIACEALSEMKRQASENIFKKSIMQRGVIVRHLVLPGCTDDSLDVLDYLFDTYKNHIYYSIMSQYTPFGEALPDELSRKVTDVEYQRVTSYAELLGIKNGFFQQGEAASESFIPLFG